MTLAQSSLMQKIITNPLILTANEADGPERRYPSFDFVVPVGEGRFWSDDEMRTRVVLVMFHVTEQGYRLEGLTETLECVNIEAMSLIHLYGLLTSNIQSTYHLIC